VWQFFIEIYFLKSLITHQSVILVSTEKVVVCRSLESMHVFYHIFTTSKFVKKVFAVHPFLVFGNVVKHGLSFVCLFV